MADMTCILFRKTLVTAIMALSLLTGKAVFAAEKKLLVFGDSLVAGYGIPLEKAFPARLEEKLKEKGYAIHVINAGVSGDTTSGGLTRLEWTLQQNPDFVILELGANDMIRSIDPQVTEKNLRKMLDILKSRKIPVLLAGTRTFPNLGENYAKSYKAMYEKLAKDYDIIYYPFFMEGVATHTDLLREDGLHPNPAGVDVIVQSILPEVEKLITAN
jgi:acyl-CoA thioesterase-1